MTLKLVSANNSSKRTRIVASHSKSGCYTCKTRRIKCDETKPTCLRCQRSDVVCEGYPVRAYQPPTNENAPSSPHNESLARFTNIGRPSYALIDRFRASSAQDRLARVGVRIFHDGLWDRFGFSQAILQRLIPQLSYALPSVNAAAAALGAVYEVQAISTSSTNDSLVTNQYGLAIRVLQLEVRTRPYGEVPLLASCILLACAEILSRRRENALLHLQGALEILAERDTKTIWPKTGMASISQSDPPRSDLSTPIPRVPPENVDTADDDITLLFLAFDVQTASFANSRAPNTPVVSRPLDIGSVGDVRVLSCQTLTLVHACFHFTAHAAEYHFIPDQFRPATLYIEQGRHIAALNMCLRNLDNYRVLENPSRNPEQLKRTDSQGAHVLLLRNLCLSARIYASTVLSPYETAWDAHASDFQQIIMNAEAILVDRAARAQGMMIPPAAFLFTPLPGVNHGLFLAGMKYRHPSWRRRAIALLRQTGTEGPWRGDQLAVIVARVAQVEEIGRDSPYESVKVQVDRIVDDVTRAGDGVIEDMNLEVIVPEKARSNGSDMDVDFDGDWRRRMVKVRHSRCRNLEDLLASAYATTGTDKREGLQNEGEDGWRHTRHWEVWDEVLKF